MTPEKHLKRGRVRLKVFDVKGAEKHFRRAIELSGRDPAIREEAADAYWKRGWDAFDLTGRAEDLWSIFEHARALYESLGEGFEFKVAQACRGISLASSKLGDHDIAADYRLISEQWCRKSRVDSKTCGNHLAKLNLDHVIMFHKLGQIDEAEAHLARNGKLLRRLGKDAKKAVIARAEMSKGILLMERGRPREAIPHLESGIGTSDHSVRTARKRLWLVEALLKARSFDNARAVLDKAEHELTREGMSNYRLHDFRARIYLEQKQVEPAIRCLENARREVEADRDLIDTEEFRTSFHGTVQNIYRMLFQLRVSDPGKAFNVAEGARARSFLDFLSTGDRRDFSGLDARKRERLESKRALMDELVTQEGWEDDPRFRKAEAKFLMLLRRYEKEILARKRVQPEKPVSAKRLCSILGKDEALVAYFLDERFAYAFAARRGGIKLRKLPVGRKDLAEEVGALPAVIRLSRREWFRLGEEPTFDDAFRDLYRLLWAPIAKDVGDARRVIIVPCDFLNQVPFSALQDGGRALSDRHKLTTMPSASVYAALKGRPSPAKDAKPRCLLVKDPTETLFHAHEEEQMLRDIFGDRLTVLSGARATPKAFAREASKHDVIHIATHARFRLERPALSYFELASGNLYHAVDVAGLNLARCKLVVLSACESGRSNAMGSDEMFGLPRAFMRAGVDCVVATLWRVEDHPELARLIGHIHRRELGMESGEMRNGAPASVWAAFTRFGA